MGRLLEICANSVQSALAAQAGGAQRIELCQNLEQGGITPSKGLIQQVRALLNIPVFVLIRPRPGDFVYNADEFAIMQADVALCCDLGCEGVVLGMLTPKGRVDVARCHALAALAGPLSVTFHRAFDDCPDQAQALEEVIATCCQRVLTSGGQPTAQAGQTQLAALVTQAAGRVIIMPGAGITSANIRAVAAATGAQEFHASAKRQIPPSAFSRMADFQTPQWETDARLVADLVQALR